MRGTTLTVIDGFAVAKDRDFRENEEAELSYMINRKTSHPVGFGRVTRDIILVCLSLMLLGFGGAKASGQGDAGTGPATVPRVIYVMDFDLEVGDIQSAKGPLQSRRQGRGALTNILPKPHNGQKEPAVQARELVDLMSTSLVKELGKLGFKATRLSAGTVQPPEGLLVRGVFAQVDEGNRLRRAVVGFGAGQTDLQVVVAVDDLAHGSPEPFYQLDTSTESRKLPGAAITMNPYVAAAKFVLSGRDMNKNVTQTAAKIAAEIARRLGKPGVPPGGAER